MNIMFACPNCNRRFSAPREDAGIIATCLSCSTQFVVPTLPPEAHVISQPHTAAPPSSASTASANLGRDIRAGFILIVLVVGLGFVHIVQTSDFFTIVPKASFTFANTFTSVEETVQRSNSRSMRDAMGGDPQLDHLVRELERRGHITSRKRTWREFEDRLRDSLPDP